MSRDEIVFGIERFAALDVTTHEGRQKLIDGFINSVFLYDDRIVLNFNGTREAHTLTLEEVKSSGSADKPQPKKKRGFNLSFSYCKAKPADSPRVKKSLSDES